MVSDDFSFLLRNHECSLVKVIDTSYVVPQIYFGIDCPPRIKTTLVESLLSNDGEAMT